MLAPGVPTVRVRQIEIADSDWVRGVRNDRVTLAGSWDAHEVTGWEHLPWFRGVVYGVRKGRDPLRWFVMEVDGERAGHIRLEKALIEPKEHLIEAQAVSIAMDPGYRGKGYGAKLLSYTVRERAWEALPCVAFVKRENEASMKLFRKAFTEKEYRGLIQGAAFFIRESD